MSPASSSRRVPFVDFAAHVAALRGELDAAVARVLDRGWFILGPEGEAFERELAEWTGARHAVGVGNGTEALQLALEAAGIGAGDEVITSPLTAAFTGLAIVRAGARPVFVDVEDETLNLRPETVERALTPRTRALMPVDLYGHPADLAAFERLATRHGLTLIEDACQSLGALYEGQRVGARGTVALSFYPTKNLGAFGDGGAVLLADAELAERVRELRNGGQRARYDHVRLGTNSRLDEIQAAFLRVKLRHLAAWVERRRALARLYDEALAGVDVRRPIEAPGVTAAYHLYVVRHARREAVREGLLARGIETLVHYPLPVHRQQAFEAFGGSSLPVAEAAAREVFSLPLYPEMADDDVRRVAQALRETLAALD